MARGRVSELDLLRFFAAFSVLLYHYTFRGYAGDDMSIMPYPLLAPVSRYGFLGVDLFFLISGFVILMSASSGSLKRFAISRIVRLYPAFWVCCTVTFVAIILLGGERYSASFGQYLVNMTMLSGFLGVPAIDGVYWSLVLEMQFYALVAVVLLFRQIHRAQGLLVLWLITTIALKVVPLRMLLGLLPVKVLPASTLKPLLQNIFVVDYSPYFIAGALFFLVYSAGLTPTRVVTILAAWIVALHNSALAARHWERVYNVNFVDYAVPGIVSAFFALIFLVATRRTGFLGRRDWMVIGGLTYPLYLIHQEVGFMIFNLAYPDINRHILLVGTIALVVAFSFFVNQKVERRGSRILKNMLEVASTSVHGWLIYPKGYTRRATRLGGASEGQGKHRDAS